MIHRRPAVLVLAAAVVALLSGCIGTEDVESGDGSLVTVVGEMSGDRAVALQRDLNAWGAEQGVRVRYASVEDVVAEVARHKPSIAVVPRPDAVRALVAEGAVPMQRVVDVARTTADVPQGLVDASRGGSGVYALPLDVSVTSVVWYDPNAFERAALDVPVSDGDLRRISRLIVDEDSGFPWCEGTAAGASTGRTLVDWLGEYVLRYGGLAQYDRWVRHEIPFDAPIARRAAQKVYGLLLKPSQVDGGGPAIARTREADAGAALFEESKTAGECFMLHQQSADGDGLPEQIARRVGGRGAVGAFALPTPDGATPAVSGSAALVTAFDADAATRRVVAYLTGPDFGTHGYAAAWTASVSPHRAVPLTRYRSPLQRASASAMRRARVFGYDASAELPDGTNAGSELTKWAQQRKTIDAALKAVEQAWPSG